jgi:aspartate aminotransferase
VATVPGSAFGAPGCIRLSFATSEADIAKALARIAQGLSTIA